MTQFVAQKHESYECCLAKNLFENSELTHYLGARAHLLVCLMLADFTGQRDEPCPLMSKHYSHLLNPLRGKGTL